MDGLRRLLGSSRGCLVFVSFSRIKNWYELKNHKEISGCIVPECLVKMCMSVCIDSILGKELSNAPETLTKPPLYPYVNLTKVVKWSNCLRSIFNLTKNRMIM